MKPRAALVKPSAAIVAFRVGLVDRDVQAPTKMRIKIVVPAGILAVEAQGNMRVGAELVHGVAGIALTKFWRGGIGGRGKGKSGGGGEYKGAHYGLFHRKAPWMARARGFHIPGPVTG